MAAFDKSDIRHQPAYALAEAARYLKLPPATLRAWTVGRDCPVADGQNRFRALIKPARGKPPLLSFNNLIEAHVWRALRTEHGVSIKALRDSRRVRLTWPTTTATRTRPARSGRCRLRRGLAGRAGPQWPGPSPDTNSPLDCLCPGSAYRIAFGPRAGQKGLTLQGAMPRQTDFKQTLCADIDGFSLHAAVRCGADDRQALEPLCRYVTGPALANERVQTNAAGQVVLKLKTPWRDGLQARAPPRAAARGQLLQAA